MRRSTMNDDERLAAARAYLAERRVFEFGYTLPTPSQEENDKMAAGEMTMLKQWDLSPVDPHSFDPTEPPGRPAK
jgi:hypothetical protein